MKMGKVLVLMLLLSFAGVTSGFLLAIIDAIALLTQTAKDAYKLYNDNADQFRGKLLVHAVNAINEPINDGQMYIQSGKSSQISHQIAPGTKEGITITQNKPSKGTEGILIYTLPNNQLLLIYFHVDQQVAWREPNRLGICIRDKTTDDVDYSDSWFESVTSDDSCLGITDFKKHLKTLQCCNDDVCAQVSMGTGHQTDANITVLPRRITDMANNLRKELRYSYSLAATGLQKQLDIALDISETCGGGIRNPYPTFTQIMLFIAGVKIMGWLVM